MDLRYKMINYQLFYQISNYECDKICEWGKAFLSWAATTTLGLHSGR